jgi:hypothetical protein
VQERDLARTRHWIAAEERRLAEKLQGEQARPAPPDWMLERGLNGHGPPVYVHAGGCRNAGRRSSGTSREEALRALTEGVPACPQCRPEARLGVLG